MSDANEEVPELEVTDPPQVEEPKLTGLAAKLAQIEEERSKLMGQYVDEFTQWLQERGLRIDPILEYRNGHVQQTGVQLRWNT